MKGKSLNDVWQKLEAQRQAERQIQIAQERALYEQRERQRQEYLQRQRMYEKVGPNSPTSAASAAAGSGGSLRRPVSTSSDESILYYSFNYDTKTFSYFINNFESGILTEVKQISLESQPSIYPVTKGGFFLSSQNDNNSNYDLLFLSLSGDIIWQDTSENTSDVDIENFSRYIAAYYLKGTTWKLVVFDKDSNVKEFSFENRIEGGGYSYDDVWNSGFVVKEEVSDIYKFYIINIELGTSTLFKEYNWTEENVNVYQYAYSDKIVTLKNYTLIEVFNSTGQKISELNSLTEFTTSSWSLYDFSFLENGSFVIFGRDNDNGKYTVTFYSGASNEFSYKIVESNNYRYDIYNQKNYRFPSNWIAEGSAIFLFYNGSDQPDDITYYEAAKILPIWSTDSQIRDFYDFASNRGINESLDDSDISIIRSKDYINLLIDNDRNNDLNYSLLRFNREGDVSTVIPTNIPKNLNLDDDDTTNGKSILKFEREFRVTGTWGWSDISDVEDRFYYSLRIAANGNFRNLVNYPIDVVMKDVVNNQYWAIRFTEWQQGGGGGFAYTRQLIEGGTFSGDPIAFTHSDFNSEPDIIVPGVLEIKRDFYGPIYNSAVEDDSNGDNPAGTLWNSEYVYNLNSSYEYKWFYTNGEASNPTNSTDFNALFSGISEGNGITYNTNIDWTSTSGKPGYLPSNDFAWQVDCLLKVDVAGDYTFNTSSDDGNQLSINGEIVTEFYGGRGMNLDSDTSGLINLSVGLHTFRYRMEQGDGGSGARVQWQRPGDGTFSVIPSSNLVINESISEYDHYIIGTDGQIIGSVSTSNSYDSDYEGVTYILEDQIFGKTWVSNKQNDGNWQLLPEYYSESRDNNNTSEESGLRLSNFIISSGFKSRIVTEDSVSSVINVPKTEGFLNKVDNRDIFSNGAWVLTFDENNANFYFYSITGQLIGQKTIPGYEWNGYDNHNYGKRCSITLNRNSGKSVIIFDGTTIKEVEFGFDNIDVSVNDYNWWD